MNLKSTFFDYRFLANSLAFPLVQVLRTSELSRQRHLTGRGAHLVAMWYYGMRHKVQLYTLKGHEVASYIFWVGRNTGGMRTRSPSCRALVQQDSPARVFTVSIHNCRCIRVRLTGSVTQPGNYTARRLNRGAELLEQQHHDFMIKANCITGRTFTCE